MPNCRCTVSRLFFISLSACLFKVTASFSFSPLSDFVPLSGPEFSCDVTEGKMGPGESLPATVTYKPTVVDTTSVEYLSLRCRGALSETLLKLTGSCVGMGHKKAHTQSENTCTHTHISYISFCNQVPKFHSAALWWTLAVLRKEKQVYGQWRWLILRPQRPSTNGTWTAADIVCSASSQQVAFYVRTATPN